MHLVANLESMSFAQYWAMVAMVGELAFSGYY